MTLRLLSTAWYFVLAVSLYVLLRPVDPGIAWALLPLVALGCVLQGVAIVEKVRDVQRRALVFFGLFLVVLGYLVARSTFLPSALGVALAIAGIGWCGLIIRGLPAALIVSVQLLGALVEIVLALWLLLAA